MDKKQMSRKEIVYDDSVYKEEEEGWLEKANTRVERVMRGYLLYCFSCNLLCNKTGNKVSISYLRYLMNMDEVKTLLGVQLALLTCTKSRLGSGRSFKILALTRH